jgi:hypothetical protein
MSFLKKLFSRQSAPEPVQQALDPTQSAVQSGMTLLAVLLDRLPTNLDRVVREFPERLPALGPLETDHADDAVFPVFFEVGGHSVWALGFDLPMPEEAQQTSIFYSNWQDEQKAPLYAHGAHVLLFYKGGSDDPVVQLSVLYAIAAGFHPLGVADQTAFNCVPGPLLNGLCSATFLLEAQSSIPTLIWTGLLKFHRQDGQTYYTTRGFERFGKPNLAFLAPTGQGEEATDLFHTLLNYQHFYNQMFEAGHTAELGGQALKLAEPHEYAQDLSGGLPLLVVSVTE